MALRHLPLQRKLVGFIFLTSLSVLLLSYLALLTYETRSSKQTTLRSLATLGDIIASNSTAALIFDDRPLATELLSGLRAEPDVISAALYDKDGKVFAIYRAQHDEAGVPAGPKADGAQFTLSDITLYRPVRQGASRVGTLFIKCDLGAMYSRLRVYGFVLIGVLVGAGVVALFLSNFFQRQISGPILDLAETAKVVTDRKDYSVRAKASSSDELAFVTEAFNTMLDQIQLNHAVLGESERRFRVVADSAPVLIWIAGTDLLCTWFNQHWLDFTGRSMASQTGNGWKDQVHPEDRDRCVAVAAGAFATRAPFHREYRMRRRDGEYRWLLDTGTPRYQGSEFVGYIGSCVDITDRKLNEALLRSSELQMRLVTDHASVFLCQLDREHRFKFVNRAYAARYGREPAELLGRHLSEVVGRPAYELAKPYIDAALAGVRQEFELELPYSTLGRRMVHYVYEPERAVDGQVAGLVSVLTDMTERRKSEQELKRARDEAVAASRAKDDFLAALSHELRTPLNPVLLLASDAAANATLPAEVRASFETIRKNVELEARLIDDLLDLTHITRDKLILDLAATDALAVIRDAVATVRADLEAKRIKLVFEPGAAHPLVWADPVRLQQVVWNVMKNAVKFTPPHGRITLTVTWAPGDPRLVVRVADTGIGMTAPELARVFDAFAQGDHADGGRSHRFGGLGLGLAISRRIVELHHGTITAASAGRNLGCMFTIELPVMDAVPTPVAPAAAVPAAIAPRAGPGAGTGKNILLVEDHAATRVALAALLQRRDYRVVSAGSVAEAQVLAATEPIDIVISDIGLPDGTGFDLMAELRSRYGFRGIALTGYGMENDLIRSRESGFVAHLTKPVRMQSLDEALERLK